MNYVIIANKALKMIAKYGSDVVVKSEPVSGVDPATGEALTDTQTSITAKGVLTNYKNGDVDGSIIRQGDAVLLLSGAIEAPKTGYIATINGDDWRIVNIVTVKPASQSVLHKCQVRK